MSRDINLFHMCHRSIVYQNLLLGQKAVDLPQWSEERGFWVYPIIDLITSRLFLHNSKINKITQLSLNWSER